MIPNRHLAAIMFTDVVGYSRLMAENEDRTLDYLEQSRIIHEDSIQKFNGSLKKEIGDGVMASFPTAAEAVQCANLILDRINRFGKLKLRVGIHVGEIVEKSSDIFGTGVNIAARVVGKAKSGQVLVTETAFHTIRKLEGICFRFKGNHRLKNIPGLFGLYCVRPNSEDAVVTTKNGIRIFKPFRKKTLLVLTAFILVTLMLYLQMISPQGSGAPGTKVGTSEEIALMPFRQLDEHERSREFAEGLMHDLHLTLHKATNLGINCHGLTDNNFSEKRNINSIETYAKEMGVRYIIYASVRTDENSVRVNVQLLDIELGRPLWTERFDRPLGNALKHQKDISQAIYLATLDKLGSTQALARFDHGDQRSTYHMYGSYPMISEPASPGQG